MMKGLVFLLILIIASISIPPTFAQLGKGDSPFERKFGDVKYLDSFFGTKDQKMEIEPGDRNVPFTVVFANVGTQDITGIRGQLSIPIGFSAAEGTGNLAFADFDSNSIAGDTFELTFFVDVDPKLPLGLYPATVKIDYGRLRESGVRNAFFNFEFELTGESIINMRALNPFLTSLQNNHVIMEISNDGSAPISSVNIVLQNTQTAIQSTTQSVTNVEKVIVENNNWKLNNINPKTSQKIELDIYVPSSFKENTVRTPMEISYFNSHGDRHTISRIVDFFVSGFIELSVYNVNVIELSDTPTVIGEIINEGNTDALFGFVTLEGIGNSNIKSSTQFVDEIETDSPVPFNVPIEFEGEPKYGEHDIKITVRYKDDLREEKFLDHETTIFIEDPKKNNNSNFDFMNLLAVPVIVVGGFFAFKKFRKKSQTS